MRGWIKLKEKEKEKEKGNMVGETKAEPSVAGSTALKPDNAETKALARWKDSMAAANIPHLAPRTNYYFSSYPCSFADWIISYPHHVSRPRQHTEQD